MLLFCCAEPPGELLFGSDWLKQVWRVSVTYSATCCCGHLGPGSILAFVRKSAQIMAEKSSQQLHEVFFLSLQENLLLLLGFFVLRDTSFTTF